MRWFSADTAESDRFPVQRDFRISIFVLHLPLPTPPTGDLGVQNDLLSLQNDHLSMQNENLSMQNGTAKRSFFTRVQNGIMIRKGSIRFGPVHAVSQFAMQSVGAPTKMTHHRKSGGQPS